MPARNTEIQLAFSGGVNFERREGITISPDAAVPIPYLSEASNVLFEGTNTIRSIGGAIRTMVDGPTEHPTSILPITANSTAKIDFYYITTDPLTTQSSVRGASLDDSSNDTARTTEQFTYSPGTILDSAEWTVAQFEGFDILMNDEIGKKPLLFDSTTGDVTAWDASQPQLAFAEIYAGRLFGAGDPSNPSRLYYSDLNDPTTGYSANFFDIDPFGGAEITAIKQYRGKLVIFKGPSGGSIHILSGRTPSTFALDIFSDSIGTLGPNSVAEFGNDIIFLDTSANLKTLATTQNFGDFTTGDLSSDIQSYIRANISLSNPKGAHVSVDPTTNRVWLTFPVGANTLDKQIMCMDFKSGIKFSFVDYVSPRRVVVVKSGTSDSGRTAVLSDAEAGFHELDVIGKERLEDAWQDSTPVAYKASGISPMIKILPNFGHNVIERACISITADAKPGPPTADIPTYNDCNIFDPNTSFDLVWQRDIALRESVSIGQTYGSRLASVCVSGQTATTLPEQGHFVLGSSRLGGPRTVESYAEMESFDFRRFAIGFSKNEINTGVQFHSVSIKFGFEDGGSTENLL